MGFGWAHTPGKGGITAESTKTATMVFTPGGLECGIRGVRYKVGVWRGAVMRLAVLCLVDNDNLGRKQSGAKTALI